jgi:probable HAF family extracellular repeat protein
VIAVAPLSTPAFVAQAQPYPYTLVDLGTLGGPQSDVGNSPLPFLSRGGAFAGTADTTISNPYAPNDNPAFNGDPYVQHTFIWRDGTLTDLGALGPQPANDSSWPASINARGDLAGASDDGTIDPLAGYEEARAVLWRDGRIVDLRTLGGNESVAFWLNSRDHVVGAAANSVPDPVSMFGFGTQTRAFHPFLWNGRSPLDLGTFGGDLGSADRIDDAGQVVGWADTTVHLTLPLGEPGDQLYQAFLWQHGVMMNLGTAPGDKCSVANSVNNRGQVVGNASMCHAAVDAFLFENGKTLNLNNLIPPSSLHLKEAIAINDRGEISGIGVLPNGNQHACVLIPAAAPGD